MLKILLLPFLLLCSANALSVNFDYKGVEDFKPLAEYESVESFEADWRRYVQDCLGNTYGGSASVHCYIGYDMWDRELNIYYKLLRATLSDEEKETLTQAQRDWIKTRDSSAKLITSLLRKKYENEAGSILHLYRSSDRNSLLVPMVKTRALALRRIYNYSDGIVNFAKYRRKALNALFKKVLSGSDEEKQKAAYKLASNFTENGVKEDVGFLHANIEALIAALDDHIIATPLTALLINDWVTDLDGNSYKFLPTTSKAMQQKAIIAFAKNLGSDSERLRVASVNALIEMKACEYREEIKTVSLSIENDYSKKRLQKDLQNLVCKD